jgi:hypothetical protein
MSLRSEASVGLSEVRFEHVVPDDEFELLSSRREIGRRDAQKPLESGGVPPKGAIVDALVCAMHQRFELAVDLLEAGEGLVPLPIIPPLPVIPAKAGIHEHGSRIWSRGGVHRFRVKPGMTNKGQGAGTG